MVAPLTATGLGVNPYATGQPVGVSISSAPSTPTLISNTISGVTTALDQLPILNPFVTGNLMNQQALLIAAPEILATTNTPAAGFMNEGIGGEVLGALVGITATSGTLRAYASVSDMLDQEEGSRAFWDEFGKSLRSQERDVISSLLMPLSHDKRNNASALFVEYLRNQKIDTEEDRDDFLLFVYNVTAKGEEDMRSEASGFGRFGAMLAAPYRAVEGAVSRLWASSAGPEDYAHRQYFTIGQNAAITLGVDPSDETAWRNTSGAIDFAANLSPLDPINAVAGFMTGIKAARSIPRLEQYGRVRSFFQIGRTAQGHMPIMSRGITSRFAFSMFSKNLDDLSRSGRSMATWARMAKIDNLGQLMDEFPELQPVIATLGESIVKSENPEHIRETIVAAMTGKLAEADDAAQALRVNALAGDYDESIAAFDRATRQAAEDGRIGIGSLDSGIHPMTGAVYDIGEEGSKVLTKTTANGDGAQKLATRVDMETAVLDQEGLAQAVQWLAKQDDTAAQAVAARLTNRGTSSAGDLAGDIGVFVDDIDDLNAGRMVMEGLSEDEIVWLERYLASTGKQALEGSDGIILTAQGRRMSIQAADIADAVPMEKVLRGEKLNAVRATALHTRAKSANPQAWVITNLPQNRTGIGSLIRGPWKPHAQGDVKTWGSYFRRNISSAFKPGAPRAIKLTHAAEGAEDLNRFLTRAGVSRNQRQTFVHRFVQSDTSERIDVINDAMRHIGEEAGHPLLENGLVNWSTKDGAAKYILDGDGNEVAMVASSRVGAEGKVAVPLTRAHLAESFPLPGDDFFRMLNRFQTSQSSKTLTFSKGLLGGTRTRRAEIGRRLRRQYERRAGESARKLTDEDLVHLAYADVVGGAAGRQNGLGAMSQVRQVASAGWRGATRTFSIAMLAFRPFAWAGRVLLEETIRAESMSQVSVLSRPGMYVSALWDAHGSRHYASRVGKQIDAVGSIVDNAFANTSRNVAGALAAGEELIPGFKALAEAEGILSNPRAMQDLAGHLLAKELTGGGALKLDDVGAIGARVLRRRDRITTSAARMEKRGLTPHMDVSMDVPEMLNRSLVSDFYRESNGAHDTVHWAPNMSGPALEAYSRGWGRAVHQVLDDGQDAPMWALRRLRDKTRGGSVQVGNRAQDFIASPTFRDLRRNIERVARDYEWEELGDTVAMVERYFDEIIEPHVENLFSPLISGDSRLMQLDSIIDQKALTQTAGGNTRQIRHSSGNRYESFQKEVLELVTDAQVEGVQFPNAIATVLDPRFGRRDDLNLFNKAINGTLQIFGETLTQRMHRQPGFIVQNQRYFNHYRGLGMSAEVASDLAREMAWKRINYVYFNQAEIPRFLRSMNDVSPFFSAMWEVASTWMYKIPMENGGLGMGHAFMLRKLDRVFDGFRNVGLIEEGDPDASGDRPMQLVLDPDAPLPASRWAAAVARSPFKVIEHLSSLTGLLRTDDDPMTAEDESGGLNLLANAKDEWRISIGNPMNPNSRGVLSTMQLGVGGQPIIQPVIARIQNRLPFMADNRISDTESETMTAYFARNEVTNESAVLRWNEDLLIEELGDEVYRRMVDGSLDPILPAGLQLQLPGTSLIKTLTDRIIFPFERVETTTDVMWAYVPDVYNHLFRSMGLWLDDGDGEGGFMPMAFDAPSQFAMETETGSQLAQLEANEGLLSQLELESQQLAYLASQIGISQEDLAKIANPADPRVVEYQEQQRRIEEKVQMILTRATDNAAGTMLTRFLMGMVMPATPRFKNFEDDMRSDFYVAREWAEAGDARYAPGQAGEWKPGQYVGAPKVRTKEDLIRFGATVERFLEDPSGSASKAWFRENYPGVYASLLGRSFWAGLGEPPEFTSIDEHFQQIEEGLVEAYSPGVQLQRIQRFGVSADLEIALAETFGNVPTTSAVSILWNQRDYKALKDKANERYDVLDTMDDMFNDSEYQHHRNTAFEEEDSLTILQEKRRQMDMYLDSVDEILTAIDTLDLDPQKERELNAALGNFSRKIRNGLTALRADTDFKQNDRDRLLSMYYEEVVTPYYERLSVMYDAAFDADSSTTRTQVFEEIRQFKNAAYINSPQMAGLNVPSEQERYWNSLSVEQQQQRIEKSIGQPPNWQSQHLIDRTVEKYPDAAQYLPTTEREMSPHLEAARVKAEAAALNRSLNPITGELMLTTGDRNKIYKQADERLREILHETGRGSEAWYLDAQPIQRLSVVGALPGILEPAVEGVNAIMGHLEAVDKGPKSELGQQLFLMLRNQETERWGQDARVREAYKYLGINMYDESYVPAVLARLFYGDSFGSLG